MLTRLSVVLVLALGVAAQGQDDTSKKDAEALQGTWTVESVASKILEPGLKGAKVTFSGDKVTVKGNGFKTEMRFKLNATKKPKHMDYIYVGEDKKETIEPMIYKLDGDKLKVSTSGTGTDRPSDFGFGTVMTYKRDKQ